MDNRTVEEAKRYHQAMKGTSGRSPESGGSQANDAKVYIGAPVSALDQLASLPDMNTLDALANTEFCEDLEVDLRRLSQVLRAAVQFVRRHSTHGTYPIEIYLVSSAVPGLDAGVYHVDPAAFALHHLRPGDHRPDLVATAGDNQSLAAAPMTLVLSSFLIRNYPSILHDVGRALAQILATASAARLAASIETSFVDGQVNRLLGLDGRAEAALCLIPLGRSLDWAEHVGERDLPEMAVKAKPRDWNGALDSATCAMHQASSLLSNEETRPLRGPCPRPLPSHRGDALLDPSATQSLSLKDVLGAQRSHTSKTVHADELWAVLDHSAADLPADFLEGPETSLIDPYVVVHRVSGLEAGLYAFRPGDRGLKRLCSGDLSSDLQKCFAESLTKRDAAAHLLLAADLEPVLKRFGNRGYRVLHIEAGVTAGRFGLAAQSMGLDAAELDFFDDPMGRFLGGHTRGKEEAVVVALELV